MHFFMPPFWYCKFCPTLLFGTSGAEKRAEKRAERKAEKRAERKAERRAEREAEHAGLDAFWGYNLNLWDIASGIVLVLEAGGTVTRSNFDKWDIKSKDILASNSLIHNKVLKV